VSSQLVAHGCHSGKSIRRGDIPPWITVDDQGRVWTTHNRGGYSGSPRRADISEVRGYLTLRLGSRRSVLAHRVVYAWFHGEAPSGVLVRHLDGNRQNNSPSNLALGDNADNMRDAVEAGSFPGDHSRGELNTNAKLTASDVAGIRSAYRGGEKQVSLAKRFGVGQTNISEIVRRKTWQHVA
jgi:hypothetical protein